MKKLVGLVLMVTLLSGCWTWLAQARFKNRESLNHLSIGMTKDEALKVMGTDKIGQCNNPYRSEILSGKDKTIEVLSYYTDLKKDKDEEDTITDDELTPLVIDNGRLIGWGNNYFDDFIQKNDIKVNRTFDSKEYKKTDVNVKIKTP